MQSEGNYMKVTIKYGDKIKAFDNQATIILGNNGGCDFIIEDLKSKSDLTEDMKNTNPLYL